MFAQGEFNDLLALHDTQTVRLHGMMSSLLPLQHVSLTDIKGRLARANLLEYQSYVPRIEKVCPPRSKCGALSLSLLLCASRAVVMRS